LDTQEGRKKKGAKARVLPEEEKRGGKTPQKYQRAVFQEGQSGRDKRGGERKTANKKKR